MHLLRTAIAVSLACAVVSCGHGSEAPEPARTATASPSESATGVDPKTRKAAQKLLDQAVDQLIADSSGTFATYVSIGGFPVQVKGSYDLSSLLMTTETTSPSLSDEEAAPDTVTLRGRVIGSDAYANVGAGPFARCWFHYDTSALKELFGVSREDAQYLFVHPVLSLVADARAIGSMRRNDFEISVKVSALAAAASIAPKLVNAERDKLPDEKVRVLATITIENRKVARVRVPVQEVFDVLTKAGMDVFGDADPVEARKELKSAVFSASFNDYGSAVTVDRPAAASVIDVSSPTDIDESHTLCRSSQG